MAIPIQNTCRLLGEPLSIAEKTDRTHQLSVISYQLSDVILNLVIKNLLFIPPFASCRSDFGVRLRREVSRTLSRTLSSRPKPFAHADM